MKKPTPGKIKINLSKSLVRDAVVAASQQASREEVKRQTLLQIQNTSIEDHLIEVHDASLYIIPDINAEWPPVPDTKDLSFEWIE